MVVGWIVAVLRSGRASAVREADYAHLKQNFELSEQRCEQQQQQLQLLQQRQSEWQAKAAAAGEKLQQLDYWRQQTEQLNQELRHQFDLNRVQEAELREVTTRWQESQRAMEEKHQLLIDSEQRLTSQFENLASRIFEHTHRRVDEQNRQSLSGLLTPLREQLDGFRRHVNDSFSQEARERHTLTHEIKQLQQLNSQMAQEALNLTNALKGDNKIQGNWGEVVLARVLEASGLREGYEYQTQVSIQHEKGRFQPDVIVRLPQGKDVVIDAKMTLVAYERYFNAPDEEVRERAAQEHILAVRQHIRGLGRKDYQGLPGLRSLDYVLMFIPVEPAFLLALDREPELINEALSHNIMLVSPTTLLVALRTINNLWRYEHQSQNAQKIAERAAKLYDKMRLFVEDMSHLGGALDKAQFSYHQAMKKLAQGRGNMLAQTEAFRQLGVEVKRPIDKQLTEQAMSDEPDSDTLDSDALTNQVNTDGR
ncbi:DNA recombination protein RmuC [Rosenbergiella australiborealis]|uniref:DNA recombination protein RmuC n=2 Tax=Rosenbergiella australiborealis TaxID=1544696 RepID=A0ABS5T5G7_9GAMM|nr:DNA recombination protein RmuC [Rosenbergiella australiborealis]MBT0727589.1 DNA recombination protein RmuC [Rosenbergiella australiborealis]